MWTVKFNKNRHFEKLCCLVEFEEYKDRFLKHGIFGHPKIHCQTYFDMPHCASPQVTNCLIFDYPLPQPQDVIYGVLSNLAEFESS